MIDGPITEGLTFDDILLLPGKSSVLPADADTTTQFTRKLAINIPLASAAMDTVTESRLAIGIARQGGIGIIHRNVAIDRQAEEIDRVKRSESGMIVDPVTISPDITIRQALEIMNKYRISGLPVTRGTRLAGILTNRDLRFEKNHAQMVGQVMTKDNLVTVPVGTTLEEAEKILQKHRIEKLLVVDRDFNLKGLITVKDIQKKLEYPRAAKDDHGRLYVAQPSALPATTSNAPWKCSSPKRMSLPSTPRTATPNESWKPSKPFAIVCRKLKLSLGTSPPTMAQKISSRSALTV
jgi:IMP dehydrogenase